MRHYLGLNAYSLRKEAKQSPVFYEPHELISPHVFIAGASGTGKSHQSRQLLNSAALGGCEIDVFDVHEEFEMLPGSRSVVYSQATRVGYNPLVLDTDPHSGGPMRQADFLVRLIRSVSPSFGPLQENALRHLLMDCYHKCGITMNDPNSWIRREISEATRESIVKEGRLTALREYYPTLADLQDHARTKVKALTIGADTKAAEHLDELLRSVSKLNTLVKKGEKSPEDKELDNKIADQKTKCIGSYRDAINAITTGREIDDILKYKSADTISGVYQRIELLNSAGIFRARAPDFGKAKVRVHQIKNLSDEQQVLLVKIRLRQIFDQLKTQGIVPQGTIRRIIYLDEAHKYFDHKDKSDIIHIIAKEGRKFGVALWLASQDPTEFPESFLTNCGALFITGISTVYWKATEAKLHLKPDSLKWVRPKEEMAVKLLCDGAPNPAFVNVIVPNPKTDHGRLAEAQQKFSAKV